ncbi:MAG: DNA topoisomerase IV subunit A [Deltaproteobacteria bacterium]|nr:DNA topoisomerase IV subunit A [Deltaproteobacteria bacterium]
MATKKKSPVAKDAPPSGGKRAPPGKKANDPRDRATIDAIRDTAAGIRDMINKKKKPELKMPVRALSNVKYDPKKGFFEIGKDKKVRTLSVATVKTFAQTLKMMALSKELVTNDDFATKRDAYYQSKNWGDARFDEQSESDTVMDDIEALFSSNGVSREQLRYIPDQHGGAVAGELVVIDHDLDTGESIEIDCTRFGSGAYAVPSWVEHLKFRTKAKFILCIETQGMFQRLQSHKYWQKASCVLVSMGGVPTRACRRFVRLLSEQVSIPVYAFTDCDPYGFANIYRTLKVGSGNAAHINQFFCVPNVKYLGLTPQDIVDFDLGKATHPLAEIDMKRAFDALKNDPFFQSQKPWRDAIDQLMKMQKRAEQQALSLHGLNFVIDEYLPAKLKHVDKFLP